MHANWWNDCWSFLAGLAAMHELGGNAVVLMVTIPLATLAFFLFAKTAASIRQVEHLANLIDLRLQHMDTVEWKEGCGKHAMQERLPPVPTAVSPNVTPPPNIAPPIYDQFFQETKRLEETANQQRRELAKLAHTQTRSLELVERITSWAEGRTINALPPDIVDVIVRSINLSIEDRVREQMASKGVEELKRRGPRFSDPPAPQKMEVPTAEIVAAIEKRSDEILAEWKKQGIYQKGYAPGALEAAREEMAFNQAVDKVDGVKSLLVDGRTAQYELVKLRACLDAEFNEQPMGTDIVTTTIKYLLELKKSSLAVTHPPAEYDARSAMQSLASYVGLHRKRVLGENEVRVGPPAEAHKAAADELRRMEEQLIDLVTFMNANQFLLADKVEETRELHAQLRGLTDLLPREYNQGTGVIGNFATYLDDLKKDIEAAKTAGVEVLRLKAEYKLLSDYLRTEEPGAHGEPLPLARALLQTYKKHVIVLRNRLNAREAGMDVTRMYSGTLVEGAKKADANAAEVMELPVDELLGGGPEKMHVPPAYDHKGYVPGVSVDDYDYTEKDGTVVRREVEYAIRRPNEPDQWVKTTLVAMLPGAVFRFLDEPGKKYKALGPPMVHAHTTSVQAKQL